MKAATIKEIKSELQYRSKEELLELCLKLARFKKENKELLTYLLFEADHESLYIESIKNEINEQFNLINTKSYFYIKKSVRKILRMTKKYIRYSKNKETEVELLLHFCKVLKAMKPTISKNRMLSGIFNRQVIHIRKTITMLHEDLQYDYNQELEEML